MTREDFGRVSYDVMKNLFVIHNELGRFFEETIYKRALGAMRNDVILEMWIDVTHGSFSKRYFMDVVVQSGGVFEFKSVDFLAPRHEYKLEWADGALRVADYALPISLAGKAYTSVYLCYVREGAKAVLKSLPNMRGSAWAWVKATIKAVRG